MHHNGLQFYIYTGQISYRGIPPFVLIESLVFVLTDWFVLACCHKSLFEAFQVLN